SSMREGFVSGMRAEPIGRAAPRQPCFNTSPASRVAWPAIDDRQLYRRQEREPPMTLPRHEQSNAACLYPLAALTLENRLRMRSSNPSQTSRYASSFCSRLPSASLGSG